MGSSDKSDYGARKLSRDTLANAIRDKRVWIDVGVVRLFDGESKHYEIDGEDLLVDVELGAEAMPLFCRMASTMGGMGRGVWSIPPIGTEVVVAVPIGDLDADPVIVGVLPSGALPEGLDEQTIVITSPKVRIEASGGDVTLASSSDVRLGTLDAAHPAPRGDAIQATLNALIALFNAHVHTGVTTGPGSSLVTPTPATLSGAGDLSDKVKVS